MKKIDNEKIFKLKTECKNVWEVKTGNKYSMAANKTVTLLFIRRTNKFNHPQETVILFYCFDLDVWLDVTFMIPQDTINFWSIEKDNRMKCQTNVLWRFRW